MYRVDLDKFEDRNTKANQIYTKQLELTIIKEGDIQKMEAFHIRGQSTADETA